jgi:DNA-binding NtrC family response regulator
MPPRSRASELPKLLERSADPIYVLDAQRRIVYANEACAQWTGRSADELLTFVCRYHSTPDETGHVPLAAALCPPPEAFSGRPMSATVVLDQVAETSARAVDFVPLVEPDGDVVAILAVARAAVPEAMVDQVDEIPATAERLHARLAAFRRSQRQHFHLDRLIGDSLAIRRIRAQVAALAGSSASVLVVGPPGSGRQHVARAIHHAAANSATTSLIPLASPLLAAEFLQTTLRALGRSKTAPQSRPTLLLNDVDHMPSAARSELLGFLRSGDAPFRVIATAREALLELPGDDRFQHELAAYLSTFVIELPPLAERLGDLPLLAQMLLEDCNAAGEKQLAGFAPEALEHLASYAWPGQIDELADVVRQVHERSAGPVVMRSDLPPRLSLAADAARHPRPVEEPIDLERHLADIERDLIERAIARAKGNKTKAARLLGLTRPRLYRRLVQLGLVTEAEADFQPIDETET